MPKPTKYDGLMDDLWVGLGFCGCVDRNGRPKRLRDFLPDTGLVTAAQFAEWAIRADWPDDDYEGLRYVAYRKRWIKPIASLFVKHMGAESVDAASLRAMDD